MNTFDHHNGPIANQPAADGQQTSLADHTVSRRSFLAGVSATAAGASLAAYAAKLTPAAADTATTSKDGTTVYGVADDMADTVAFDGPHQAGIATGGQAECNLVGFTVRAGVGIDGVKNLLTLWTEDARRLTAGQPPLGSLEPEMTRAPASLTITCGFGSRLFDIIGKTKQRPQWLQPLPTFSRDQLDDRWGPADLVLQICSNDPLMLSHATRHMIRSGVDYVSVRWFQHGFLPPDGARETGGTPRNLFGVKDGTVNPGSDKEYDDIVWITDGPQWLRGGSCMVVRRIAMDLDGWEKLDRQSRANVFGRKLDNGAPLTGEHEFDTPDFAATDEYGLKIIDPHSHMARSHNPDDKPLQKIRRRAYSYDLPPDPTTEATSNSGLIFICFQKNPLQQFVPIQTRLDQSDRMNQWVTHIGSAVFACPPGTSPDGQRDYYWGQQLLES